jgi:hypothetical protein
VTRRSNVVTSPYALSKPLTRRGVLGRKVLKKFLYSQLALRQGLMIVLGKEQPLVRFTVEGDPPSVYVVYRVRDDRVADLGVVFGLASGLVPTPIRCIDGEAPQYYLVLNYYRVSGLARGLRAEWSIFVADEIGVPRYMVVDACSNEFSIDPVDVKTRRSPVAHRREANRIVSAIGEADRSYECTIDLDDDATDFVKTDPQWSRANDFIYWTNGICDRTFYDAGMHDARVRRVPATSCTIIDRTPWRELVEAEPVHVLVFEDAIELAMSPWENLAHIRGGARSNGVPIQAYHSTSSMVRPSEPSSEDSRR